MIQEVIVAHDMPRALTLSKQAHHKAILAFLAKTATEKKLAYGVLKQKRTGWSFEFNRPGETAVSRMQAPKLADLLGSITVDCIVLVWEQDWQKVRRVEGISQKATIYQGDV